MPLIEFLPPIVLPILSTTGGFVLLQLALQIVFHWVWALASGSMHTMPVASSCYGRALIGNHFYRNPNNTE